MTFITTGTFTCGGTASSPGQIIPITVGLTNGSYKGSTVGAHDLLFTVVNQNSVQKTSAVKLTYSVNDFSFSTTRGLGKLCPNFWLITNHKL